MHDGCAPELREATRTGAHLTVPVADLAVCSPAFRPDRCIREEAAGSSVAARLAELHGKKVTKEEQPAKAARKRKR